MVVNCALIVAAIRCLTEKALLLFVHDLGFVLLFHNLGVQEGVVETEEVKYIISCQLDNEAHSGLLRVGFTV